AGLSVFTSYLIANRNYGVPGDEFLKRCTVAPGQSTVPDLECWQTGTGATITLLVVFFAILIVLARPLVAWKLALVGTLVVVAVLAFVLPPGREFFGFDAPAGLVWQSLAVGAVGAGVVELIHRFAPVRGLTTHGPG
ncbi:MAG: ATPase, partial [Terracoccus sp.]